MNSHLTEDQIERFLMNSLPPAALHAMENHLLECAVCQERAFDLEDYIKIMREAMIELSAVRTPPECTDEDFGGPR